MQTQLFSIEGAKFSFTLWQLLRGFTPGYGDRHKHETVAKPLSFDQVTLGMLNNGRKCEQMVVS